MEHHATPAFWKCYESLPPNIQNLADQNFALLKNDSKHPSLHFKKVLDFWSVRVGIQYRALAVEDKENLIWFWIGSHAEYDKLIQ